MKKTYMINVQIINGSFFITVITAVAFQFLPVTWHFELRFRHDLEKANQSALNLVFTKLKVI